MKLEKSDVAEVLALLRYYGYVVETSTSGKIRRVVLRHGAERWTAEAPSTADALNDLLGRMLPSAITKSLFATALSSAAPSAQPASATRARSTSSGAGPQVVVRRRVG